MTDHGDCLDDATFAELLGHTLDAERLAAAEVHLDGCPECRRHLSELSRLTETAGEPDGDAPSRRLGGRYEILRSLGRGGMGEVFVAHDAELGRRVAVKLLHHAGGDDAAQARLRREAQAMARLAHPNVVPVFDLGLDGERVFVAMELVEGATLAAWARDRSPREIIAACVAAGRGVAAAHGVGLVHRDLTPRNVLVGSDGRARVTDFGLVQITGADAEPAARAPAIPEVFDDLTLTRTGEFVGTPAYASPEALRGGPVDERSDQWSLAATAWHVVFGRLPFARASFVELADAVRRGVLDSPGPRRGVPARVRNALRRAMAPDPRDRHPSIDALLVELAPRRRGGLAIAAAGVAVLALGAVSLGAHGDRGREACAPPANTAWTIADRLAVLQRFAASPRPVAITQFARIDRAFDDYLQQRARSAVAACAASRSPAMLELQRRCFDEHVAALVALRDQLETPLDDAQHDAAVIAAVTLPALDACADVTALARLTPPGDPVVAAREAVLRTRLARVRALSALDRSVEALDQARQVAADAAAPGLTAIRADALYELGNAQDRAGDVAAARTTLEQAGHAAAAAHDDHAIARAWLLLLHIIGGEAGRPQDALGLLPVVTASVERAGDPLLEARFHGVQGIVLVGADRMAEARAHEERAVALFEQQLGPDHLDTATAQLNLAALLFQLGELDRGTALHLRAVATLEQLVGPDHSTVGRAMANLGHALADLRRWPEAEAALLRAQAIFERAFASDHLEVAWTQRDLAHLWLDRGDWSKARAYYERALPTLERSIPGSGGLAAVYANIGATFVEQGRCAEATPRLVRAIELATAAYGGQHFALGGPLLDRARCATDPREVTALVDRALALTSDDPLDLAERQFLAAKALAATPSGARRATELATAARATYAAGGAAQRDDYAEVDRWLAGRAAGRN